MSRTIFIASDNYGTQVGAFHTVFDAVVFLQENNHIDKDLEKDIESDMDFPEDREEWTEEHQEYFTDCVYETIGDEHIESIELHGESYD